jgi:putative tryptophan/tyrosine transport system substrate-binding protein
VTRTLYVILLGFAVLATAFSSARADEAPNRTARVGLVMLESASIVTGPAVFRARLAELGWVEGRNLVIEARFGDGHFDRLPALISDIIGRNVDVIVTGGVPTVLAVKRATSTIPIVVCAMSDPVELGIAASLARPGGNLTGLSLGFSEGFAGKWLELLHEAVPRASTLAVVLNPESKASARYRANLQEAAAKRGLKLRVIEVSDADRLEAAFQEAGRVAQAVIVPPDPFTLHNSKRIASLAQKYRLPSMYGLIEYVTAGGFISYGPDLRANWRRGAELVDRVLRGTKPGDIPIEQPTQYTLAVNLKTAKALGITIPQSILVRADEVIR